MALLTIVVGLPGSGKTRYLESHRSGTTVFDDYMKDSQGGSEFRASRSHGALIHALRSGAPCLVTDIELCRTPKREAFEKLIRAEVPGVEIAWRFFANDPRQCVLNARSRKAAQQHRDLELEERKIAELSAMYHIPEGGCVLAVWNGT